MTKIPWQEIFTLSGKDVVKILITALIILIVTKVQLFSDRISALVIALPITSLIAIVWMQAERQKQADIANHAENTFWFVLPSLPMFLILPWMLRNDWNFWVAMGTVCALTVGFFYITVLVLRLFGIDLLGK